MNFAEYTQLALRTKAPHNTRDHTMMGLFGEAGEVVDLIKKVVAHDHPITPELCDKMRKEIGDTLWYVALGADEDQVSLYDVFDRPNTHYENLSQDVFDRPNTHYENLSQASYFLRRSVSRTDRQERSYVDEQKENYTELCYALASIARLFGTTLEQCAIENIEKLRKRYPDGFSSEASQARVDVVRHDSHWSNYDLDVVAKQFVLMRKHREDKGQDPWYLCPSQGRSRYAAWTNKEEHAIRFNTADEAMKAIEDGMDGYVRNAYVFRAKAIE